MRAFILLLLLLAGCSHTAVVVNNAHPVAPASNLNVNTTGAVAAAVLIGTAAIAASQGVGDPQSVPGLAPEREVSEQDCTRPIDLTAGNLRCR